MDDLNCLFCERVESVNGCCKECLEVLRDPVFSKNLIKNHLRSKLSDKLNGKLAETLIDKFINIFAGRNK